MKHLWFLLVLCLPMNAWSGVTPCLTRVDTNTPLTREQSRKVFTRKVEGGVEKWLVSDEDCIQQTRTQAEKTAQMKIEFLALKKKWLNIELELKNTKAALKEWETVRYPSWKTRIDLLATNVNLANQNALMWRETAEKYRTMYLSRQPRWYQHPIFVAVVSSVVTAGVLYLGSHIGQAIRP